MMPSPNQITIACAGSGKTTGIAKAALVDAGKKKALITYTQNGAKELRDKIIAEQGYVPTDIEISTWYAFLLRHFVRPYQRVIYDDALVRRITWIDGQSARYAKKTDIPRFYFSEPGSIYSDKVSQFACEVINAAGVVPVQRLEAIYQGIYIDEIQDLAGYDLDLVEVLLKSPLTMVLVGDVRQSTYQTNHSRRNKKYSGPAIIEKFEEWEAAGLCKINHATVSRRCVQSILDLADKLFPNLPPTTSGNDAVTGHDGVYCVRESQVTEYFADFSPQTLRLDAKTSVPYMGALNYGAAKGMTFHRTILFPHKAFLKAVVLGDMKHLGSAAVTIAKVYVGLTRARQSVAIVIPDDVVPENIPLWQPAKT